MVRQVIVKYKKKCVACSKFTTIVHHLDGWDWCYSGRYDPNNCVLVCSECHKRFHNIYGYGQNTRYQFDSFLRLYYNRHL